MITEIIIAEKLSKIRDLISNENIVNSGRVQGINIYKEKINILITKKHDKIAVGKDKIIAIKKAFCININWKGIKNSSKAIFNPFICLPYF